MGVWDGRGVLCCRWVLERGAGGRLTVCVHSVIEWGVARPSYGKPEEELTEEEKEKDARWAEQLAKKQQLQLTYNKVAKLDGIWRQIKDCFKSVADLEDENMEVRCCGSVSRSLARRLLQALFWMACLSTVGRIDYWWCRNGGGRGL